MVKAALVVCVILFILTVFISPIVDLQPTALRALQWVSFMIAMLASGMQIVAGILPSLLRIPSDLGLANKPDIQRPGVVDSGCSLRC